MTAVPRDEAAAVPRDEAAAAGAPPARRRVHVYVAGRVQGVWFRDSARHEALRLGVDGWVRNLPDGSVEAVYEGTPQAVGALIAWTRQGPADALVTGLRIDEEAPREERGFFIVR